ncbi:MAG: hypothetical protein LBR08_08130 [Bacteroidales bacterium]|jgi:hypothetical protein|nr:hypothetical protein [Bacteroidales bacterium]
MPKSRKKAKKQIPRLGGEWSIKMSKNYFDQCYAVVRKMLRHAGLDPGLLDGLTKRQKQDLCRFGMEYPRVRPEPGHSVPRQYVRYTQNTLVHQLNTRFFDESLGLTHKDMCIYGLSFIYAVQETCEKQTFPPPQHEIIARLDAAFTEQDMVRKTYMYIIGCIKQSLWLFSQPNFRVYGFTMEVKAVHAPWMSICISIVEHKCRTRHFSCHNERHTGYLLAMGQSLGEEYRPATISLKKIYPNAKRDRQLNIYIQAHAIHRFKERINTVFPIMRNQFFLISLMLEQQVVQGAGGHPLIACITPNREIIGYFAFTIENDNLFVLTLLPLLSPDVPEGSVCCERLNITTEDMKYLGMDKLSFFYDVDFDRIPVLKKVLIEELGLGYIRNIYHSFKSDRDFDEKKTLFVKNFFRNLEEPPVELTVPDETVE